MYNSEFNESIVNLLKDLQKNFTNLEHLNPLDFAKNFINLDEFQKMQTKQQEQIKAFIDKYSTNDYSQQIIDFSNKFTGELKEKFEQSTEMHKQMLESITAPEYKQHLEQFLKVNEKLSSINNEMIETTQSYFTHMINLNKEGLSVLQAFNPFFFTATPKNKNKAK